MRKLIVATALVIIFGIGCSMRSVKTEGFAGLKDTSIYVAQPSDLTHGGALVKGSGDEFLLYLKSSLNEMSKGNLRVVTTENVVPRSDNIIADAFNKAKESSTEYILIITLGEMRDAAPMTFRSDYVSIQEGVLYRLADNKEVWRALPYKMEGGNITKYNSLLDDLAKKITESIIGN